uniref:Uncharacterized protein n=1 Tax=Arundo donax TaxID=35708 RepID=A0A0A9D2F5_ARUDO
MGVSFVAVTTSQDDRNGRRDDGVGSPHHRRKTSPKERLAQGVDTGNEQQRLNHPSLLLISSSHLGNKSTWYDDRCAQHHKVVLESKYDGLRPGRWACDAVGHAGQLVLHRVRLQLLLLGRRRRPSSGHPPPLLLSQ